VLLKCLSIPGMCALSLQSWQCYVASSSSHQNQPVQEILTLCIRCAASISLLYLSVYIDKR
jgi:hypothetical protein